MSVLLVLTLLNEPFIKVSAMDKESGALINVLVRWSEDLVAIHKARLYKNVT